VADVANVTEENDSNLELPLPLQFTRFFEALYYRTLSGANRFSKFPHFMEPEVDCVWNVMAHAQKPDFVFQQKGWVHLNRQGCQFSRLLGAEVCASELVMLDTPCSEVLWRVLATHSIRQFPLHFPFLRHRVPTRFNRALHYRVHNSPPLVPGLS